MHQDGISQKIEHSFLKILCFLVIGYFLIEYLLIPHLNIVWDEFWFAQHIFHYTYQLPYRDFLPYKTTLGYYLLTLPFFYSHQLLTPIFLIKTEIALINAIAMGSIAYYSTRFFNKTAILITLTLIIINQLFLLYSVELRVDLLSSWLGLVSVLLILYRKNSWAGLILGMSFLCCQKALWFIIAINCAFMMTALFTQEKKTSLLGMVLTNSGTLTVILLYFLVWSFISSPALVWQNMFYEAYTQSIIHWYTQAYIIYWKFILANGCLLISLIPLTWLTLFTSPLSPRRFFIAIFSLAMTIMLVCYQQPFPYNMVFLVPSFFLIYADFFTAIQLLDCPCEMHSRGQSKEQTPPSLESPRQALGDKFHQGSHNTLTLKTNISLYITFIATYLTALFILFTYFEISSPYYLILGTIVIAAIYFVKRIPLLLSLFFVALFFTGFFYPFIRTIEFSIASNNDYQKYNLIIANKLVKNEGGYIAGTPLLYYQKQPIKGLENLISPAIAYLYKPAIDLLPILIPSLYLYPMTQADVIAQLKNKPVKIYVNNTRMHYLPPAILNYLHREFLHYWGSIYIYAPYIDQAASEFILKFRGQYQVVSSEKAGIYIDQKQVTPGKWIILAKGAHTSHATESFRLKLTPKLSQALLNPAYKDDHWEESIK